MTNETKTPGYNSRLQIRFKVNKNGRKMAHYWSRPAGGRWMPIGLAKAEVFVATGTADRVENFSSNCWR